MDITNLNEVEAVAAERTGLLRTILNELYKVQNELDDIKSKQPTQ